MMELLHAIVHHETFGRGEVIEMNNDVISASFPKPYGKKKFVFPTAFNQHLTLEDASLSAEMAEILKQNHILVEAEEQRIERANRMAQYRADSIEKANVSSKSKKKK
ncbi:MAG: hypothetical protein PHW41_08395 [Eubacteriales bacterium]|nr:hypothetical protein [Eubacteriales bacterium]